MTTVYNLCKLLIDRGRTDGLQDKMDVYLAADRLTPEEYQKLAGLLAQAGISISRRTVAKYREELQIPKSADRADR